MGDGAGSGGSGGGGSAHTQRAGSEGLSSQRSMSEAEGEQGGPSTGRGKRQRVTKSALELLMPTREQLGVQLFAGRKLRTETYVHSNSNMHK